MTGEFRTWYRNNFERQSSRGFAASEAPLQLRLMTAETHKTASQRVLVTNSSVWPIALRSAATATL